MSHVLSALTRAFKTLNRYIFPVVLLAFIESWRPVVAFHIPQPWAQVLVWPEFVGIFLLKTVFTAFAIGYLVDNARGETLLISDSFARNKKAFFNVALWTGLLPYLMHFPVFLLFHVAAPFHLIQAFLQPLIVVILVKVVMQHKYPEAISSQVKKLNGTMWMTWGITSVFFLLAYAFYYFLPEEWLVLKAIGIFLVNYAAFWVFLSIVYTIMDRMDKPIAVDEGSKTIVLVNPVSSGLTYSLSFFAFQEKRPYTFNILRALTPQGYTFREFNRVPWNKENYIQADIVGITCFSNNCIEAYKIARGFRQRGSTVVMGGSHVTAFPDEALEFCDAVVTGPVESVWCELIHDHENGVLKKIYAAKPAPEDYDKVTQFLLTQPPEVLATSLETTRGCKFNCYFCGAGHLKIGYYKHPLDVVVELVRRVSRVQKVINFMDDNIYSDPAYAKELFKRLAPLKIRWAASSSIDIAQDPEALRLCRESGCVQLLIGYEIFAGSKEIAKAPKFAMAKDYIHLTNNLKKAGIQIKGQFIYGFATDSFTTFWKLWAFAFRIMPTTTALSLFTPIPNSRFYKDVEDQDRFINLNWNRLDLLALTYDHPRLNNPFFRNGFILAVLFFFTTTSALGIAFLVLMTGYFYFGLF